MVVTVTLSVSALSLKKEKRIRHGWCVCPRTTCCSYLTSSPSFPGSYYCVDFLSKDKACNKEKDKKDNNVGPCAHCFHVPHAVGSWKAHVGEVELRAMSTMNKETFDA